MLNKILIGVPTRDTTHFTQFYDYFNQLEKPENSIIQFVRGQSPARNRNIIIETALKMECSHIFFLDDDTVPPKDALIKLLEHNLDIVTGLYLMRNYPFKPILFDYCKPGQLYGYHFLNSNNGNKLIKVVNCGLGCVLIKIEVFKKMLNAGLALLNSVNNHTWITLGQAERDHWSDDTVFFSKVQSLGYEIYADLSVEVGHASTIIVKPHYINGQWLTLLDSNGEGIVTLPAVQLKPELVEK